MDAEHQYIGTREVDAANFQGIAHACSCGEKFEDKGALLEHIEETRARERREKDGV